MSSRDAIAAAANAVDGVEVFPEYELVTTAGQGWIEWLRTDYPNTLGGEDYWGVVFMLPTDLKEAQRWISDHRHALWDALGEAMVVTQARPEIITLTDNQSIRALVIEGHREAEE